MKRAVLLVSCPDRRGLVARLSTFIDMHGGNILYANQHIDSTSNLFLTRIEWDLDLFDLRREEIEPAFNEIAREMQASWRLEFDDDVPSVAIFVTRQDHCLLDLLWRYQAGELPARIPLIVSNHPDLEHVANHFGVEYHYFSMTPETRLNQEQKELKLLAERGVNLVILAKYMQVLSPRFIDLYPRKIINIHHSFLPAFPGANPYHRAYERGVKIIGATAHYVTTDLDEGPIIEQDIVRVTHRDSIPDLILKGKDLERTVLARAVRFHLDHRILVYGNKTVVFA